MDTEVYLEAIENQDGSIEIHEDGVRLAKVARGTEAGIEWLKARREVTRLRRVIDVHAGWLQSMTPDQVNDLDCGTLRATAQELRFLGQING